MRNKTTFRRYNKETKHTFLPTINYMQQSMWSVNDDPVFIVPYAYTVHCM